MNRRTTLLALSALLSGSAALADHQQNNLKEFRSVCLSTFVEIKSTEDENAAELIFNALADQLGDAGVRVNKSPCQDKGLTSARQLNLYYTFTTTAKGSAYLGLLEGWLSQEGKYSNPVVWSDYIYGAPVSGETPEELAEQLAADLTDNFTQEWEKSR